MIGSITMVSIGGALGEKLRTIVAAGVEIMQRGGYKGYGAPNAGARLAAQTREARPRTMPRIS